MTRRLCHILGLLALSIAATGCGGDDVVKAVRDDQRDSPTSDTSRAPGSGEPIDLAPEELPTSTPAPTTLSAPVDSNVTPVPEPIVASPAGDGSTVLAGSEVFRSRVATVDVPVGWVAEYIDRPSAGSLRSLLLSPDETAYLVIEATPGGSMDRALAESIASQTIDPSPIKDGVVGDRFLHWFTFTNNSGVPSIDVFFEVEDISYGVVSGSATNAEDAYELAFSIADTLAPPLPPTGDLGLARPLSWPVCDGSYVVVLASSWGSAAPERLGPILEERVASSYLRADRTCPSLNAARDNLPIYAAYLGPFSSVEGACAEKWRIGAEPYVRVLDLQTPPSHQITCTRP